MTTKKRTTPAPKSASITPPVLRPVEVSRDSHPDARPCPPWCWVAANNPDGYAHEVDPGHIQTAIHTIEECVRSRASLYRADSERGDISAATFESRLQQSGGGMPTVRVALRSYAREKDADGRYRSNMKYDEERVSLTIEDARELAAVLTYLADLSEVQS